MYFVANKIIVIVKMYATYLFIFIFLFIYFFFFIILFTVNDPHTVRSWNFDALYV